MRHTARTTCRTEETQSMGERNDRIAIWCSFAATLDTPGLPST
jgi:hypothetical protein